MPTKIGFATALLAFVSRVSAQIATCLGNQAPDYDACDEIYSFYRGSVDLIDNFYPGCTNFNPPDGTDPNAVNCIIQWCPATADVQETVSGLDGYYDLIGIDCPPAGGTSGVENTWSLNVVNNPDFDPDAGSTTKRSTNRRRNIAKPSKRQAEDDTDFTLVVLQDNVERDGIQITGRLPAGSMYMISSTDSQSTSVSVSVEVGASFFDFFSASVGTTVTSEQSTSNTEGISINIDCDPGQSGQVFWYPLYTVYQGFTTPSNTNVDVVVPIDSPASGSNYRVTCLE